MAVTDSWRKYGIIRMVVVWSKTSVIARLISARGEDMGVRRTEGSKDC